MGIPFRQMHSWDYSGPYHGYDGFAIFARDMDMAINNPAGAWSWRRGSHEPPADRCMAADIDTGAFRLSLHRREPRARDRRHDERKVSIMPQIKTSARPFRALPRAGIQGDARAHKRKLFESPRTTADVERVANGQDARNTRRRTSTAKR